MTDLNPQDNAEGLLASKPQVGQDRESQDFDAATSIGASINESMMMPSQTLATDVPDLSQLASISVDMERTLGSDDELAPRTLWQKQAKVMDQKIRQNPYAYIAGALGLGLVVGRSLISGRSHSV